MTELSTVAGAIKALSFDRETQAYEQGSRFARNKLERVEVVTAAAQTIGADPSYEEWEAYRVQWVDGHAHQNPDLTANASDKAWKEFAKLLDELYGMTKPKSTGAAAVKKSEQREKAQEALLEKYEDQSAWELRDQLAKNYKKLADKPDDLPEVSPRQLLVVRWLRPTRLRHLPVSTQMVCSRRWTSAASVKRQRTSTSARSRP